MTRSRPGSDDFRRLGALALPVVFVQVGLMAMGVVDTMIVGRLSPTALAGVAVGNVYAFAVGSFGMGVLMALDPLVSQAVGAGDRPAIARALQRGLVIAAALSVVATLVLLPVGPVLRALGQPPAMVDVAAPFAHALIPGMAAFFIAVTLRQTLQAMGRMRPVVIAIVVTNVLNGVLAWALVFGELGLPRLEGAGAGVATSVSRWVMALLMLALGWPALRPHLAWRADALRAAPLARMVRIGLPIGLQVELEYGVFAAVALVMGHLGPVPAGAHQIAINIASLTFMVPLGVASAASVLVGRAVGAGLESEARRAGVAAIAVGAGFMVLSAAALTLAPGPLARAYTPDAEVVALAALLIPIAGVFQVFDGVQVVSIGVLRGVGDTRTPLVVNLIGYWVLALPVALWLAFRAGLGPVGLWWGLVAGLMIVAVVLLARVRARLWRPLARLVVDEAPAAALEGAEPR
uniref:Multidrug-efflux transporter n=1 Tax=Eiseniibacteriota bacterium TaxID=2212470 RepID=A0A832I2H8_UNCEI